MNSARRWLGVASVIWLGLSLMGCNTGGSGGGTVLHWTGSPVATNVLATSRVHGIVTDNNGASVSGAAVTALIGTTTVALTTTANDGSFALQIEPGAYVLSVSKEGFAINRQQFVVAAGDDRLLISVLGPRASITGKVLLATTREPLSNIDVRVFDSTGLFLDLTRSNIEGTFVFQDLAIGR